MTQMKQTHRFTRQTRKLQTHRTDPQTLDAQDGPANSQTHRTDLWVPRGWLRVWDSQEQTVIRRLDKQGLTVQDRDLYSVPRDKPKWKRI